MICGLERVERYSFSALWFRVERYSSVICGLERLERYSSVICGLDRVERYSSVICGLDRVERYSSVNLWFRVERTLQ